MKQDADMEVVSIKNILDKDSADHEICSSFILIKENVVKYFLIAEQVDEHEFHHDDYNIAVQISAGDKY